MSWESWSFEKFKNTADVTLTKNVKVNQHSSINITITKEIMKWSRRRNKFLNTKNEADRKSYNKQSNFCVILLRNAK